MNTSTHCHKDKTLIMYRGEFRVTYQPDEHVFGLWVYPKKPCMHTYTGLRQQQKFKSILDCVDAVLHDLILRELLHPFCYTPAE